MEIGTSLFDQAGADIVPEVRPHTISDAKLLREWHLSASSWAHCHSGRQAPMSLLAATAISAHASTTLLGFHSTRCSQCIAIGVPNHILQKTDCVGAGRSWPWPRRRAWKSLCRLTSCAHQSSVRTARSPLAPRLRASRRGEF
eukprot:1714512-Rhodomonas_salina.2